MTNTTHTPGALYAIAVAGDVSNAMLAFYGSDGCWYDADTGEEYTPQAWSCEERCWYPTANYEAIRQAGAFDARYAAIAKAEGAQS
jgi:hypothetical protein